MKRHFVKIAGLLALVVLLASASIAAGPPFPNPGIDRAINVANEHATDVLMDLPGVVGFGVGLNEGGRAVIFAFTERPGVPGIPGSIEGVPVVPQVTGKIVALDHNPKHKPGGGDAVDTTARFPRPVPIGVSTGHPDVTAGTIGARVTDGTNAYALSNNHVYANSNAANIADPVIQPGAYDGGVAGSDTIGNLSAYKEILWHQSDGTIPTNKVDAAIALSGTDNLGNATPSNGYGVPKSQTAPAVINAKVQKYGRTTGLTKGFVWAINSTVDVQYGPDQVARFVGQIVLKGQGKGGFSAGGDSGSLIVTTNRNPVGLLFAGNSFFDYTFANPIDDVLASFGVSVDGE
ncbi:MAG: hypothetical protein HYX84_02885 [Chloroflexi bacterium]|nr:hypothetical protein [Chloroflexota bacterium]